MVFIYFLIRKTLLKSLFLSFIHTYTKWLIAIKVSNAANTKPLLRLLPATLLLPEILCLIGCFTATFKFCPLSGHKALTTVILGSCGRSWSCHCHKLTLYVFIKANTSIEDEEVLMYISRCRSFSFSFFPLMA